MGKIIFTLIFCVISGLVLAAPQGNDNKFVFEWEESWPVDCDWDGTPDLWADMTGWFQGKYFKGKSKNVELNIFHLDTLYTNDSGETWVWRDRGPDRYYYLSNDDGIPEFHVALTGRSGWNIIGHVVWNLDTDEFELVAGQHPFGGDDSNFMDFWADNLACEILF
jgi:hypothetical protein